MGKVGTVELNYDGKNDGGVVHLVPTPPGGGKQTVQVGNIQVQVGVEARLSSRREIHRAAEVKIALLENLIKELAGSSGTRNETTTTKSEDATTLKIELLQCQEGSRWGRMCCGGLGFGWVVLEAEWQLTRGRAQLASKQEKLRDSGAIGFADLGDKDFGHRALLQLAHRMAQRIASESKKRLHIS